MIKALIFDCFGVLYQDGRTHIDSFAPAEKATELRDLYRASDHGAITRREFLLQLSNLTGLTEDRIQELTDQAYIRNDALLNYIRTKKSEYMVGMLSNVGNDFIETLFSKQELTELFDDVVLSYMVGVTKPSEEIYIASANRLGVLPEECLFTDDLAVNVDGAQRAGMHSVLFTSIKQFEHDVVVIKADNA